ncbi:hypothetical protein ACFSS7_11975 [Elizabethkingia anophelis]|uniref:hypothetical protein n=1 Tax=Elizabethkingia anophelis TaxID=1117645 RepID=UPI0036356FDC
MFYLIVFVCSFLAFGISAICGGGAGLMLIPVLNRFFIGGSGACSFINWYCQ